MNAPKMPLYCLEDDDEVFRQMARQMVEEIENHNARGERTIFICPVGPVGQYPYFVEMINEKWISLRQVWFINMDEYLDEHCQWVPKDHPLSFRGFMERKVYSRIRPELVMPPGQRIFPDPNDVQAIPKLIENLRGVDVVFGGIDDSGHVAFNEADGSMSAEEFLAQKTRVLKISPETQTTNASGDFGGALEDMPHYCVTIGMDEIVHARKIRLACLGNRHRAAVRRLGYGDMTPEFPVSLLRNHPDITLTFPETVAMCG